MLFSPFIARRYFTARKKSSAVGIITGVSVTGVAVAVFAMFVVLSVFSGLRRLNVVQMGALTPDIRVYPARGKVFVADSVFLGTLAGTGYVDKVGVSLEEKAFVSYRNAEIIARIKGVDGSYPDVVALDSVMVKGVWLDTLRHGYEQSVIGAALAYRLGIGLNDTHTSLRVYVPSGRTDISLSPDALFTYAEAVPSGIFSHQDYDSQYIFTTIGLARELLGRGPYDVSCAEIRIFSGADAEKAAQKISSALGPEYSVKTAAQENELYYRIMNTENIVLYFVFALIVAIALFNVAGSVVMLILDKKEDIRTMRALGADRRSIVAIFVTEGMMVVGAGAAVGLAAGCFLVWLQAEYSLVMIEGNVNIPYPVMFSWYNIIIVIFTISTLGYAVCRMSVGGIKFFLR